MSYMLLNLRSIFGQKLINYFWHFPKNIFLNLRNGLPGRGLKIIGITGTDGKTSTCVLLHHILQKAGYKSALISTIGAKIGDEWLETQAHMTTPDTNIVQSLLKKIKKQKVDYLIMEVTSIALDQYRYMGCKFDIGVFLNLAHDHLDYHKTMDNYLKSKATLLQQSRLSIANSDDHYFNKLKNIVRGEIVTFGKKQPATFLAKNIFLDKQSLSFKLGKTTFKTDSNYEYQIYNILAAISVCKQLNISDSIIQNSILPYPETKGRREEVSNNFGLRCLVDYGHTPQAFENTFSSLKKTTTGKLISIFGATGGRDKTKRPEMGRIAQKYCNIIILTSDDTRHESLSTINQEIVSGMNKPKIIKLESLPTKIQISQIKKNSQKQTLVLEVDSRQDAITTAVLIANNRDTLVALGIGHQKSILIGKTDYPWSEVVAFKTAFNHREMMKYN